MQQSARKPTPAAPDAQRGTGPAARERPAAGALAFPVSTHAAPGARAAAAPPPPPAAPPPRATLRRRRAEAEGRGTCPRCAAAMAAEAATGVRASLCPSCEAAREAGARRLPAADAGPGAPSPSGEPRTSEGAAAGPVGAVETTAGDAARPATSGGGGSAGTPQAPPSPPQPPAAGGGGGAPPLVPGGGGRALDAGTRAYFEARLGRDLGGVRVHTGPAADASARSVQAVAFALGPDVVFRADRFSPGTGEGRGLLAHELTHVAQQGFAPPASSPAPATEGAGSTRSATATETASAGDATSAAAESGRPASPSPSAAGPMRSAAGDGAAAGPASHGLGASTSEAGDERQAGAVAARVAGGGSAADLLAGTAPRPAAVRRQDHGSAAPAAPAAPGGDRLGEPLPVTFGADLFEATVERREAGGWPEAVVRLRYRGTHPNDLTDGEVRLWNGVAPRPFNVRRLAGVENELVLDLYGDLTTVLRVEDDVEHVPGTRPARAHHLKLRVAGVVRMTAMTFRVFDPAAAASDTRAFRQPELAGQRGTTRDVQGIPNVVFDGDGDGMQELEANFDFYPSLPADATLSPPQPDRSELVAWLVQRSAPARANHGTIFRLPPVPAGETVDVRPRVEAQSDGTAPSRIAVTEPLGDRRALVHPPVRTATEITYDVEVAGQRRPVHMPPDREPPRRLYTATDGGRVMGKNAFWDVDVGPYGDRFRISVDRGDEAHPVLGVAPFFDGEPVGGRGATLTFSGPLAGIRLLAQDPVTMALDLDGDGRPDVRINDRLEQPADLPNSTPEGDRDHRFSLTGPAIPGGAAFTVHYRGGHLATGHRPETAADAVAARAMLATGALTTSAASTYASRVVDYTDAFGTYRRRAMERGWISRTMFDAWYGLSASMMAVDLQAPSGTVDPGLRDRAAGQARALFAAMTAETLHVPSGPGSTTNPYTGASTTFSHGGVFTTPGAAATLGDDLAGARWAPAAAKFRTLTDGLDRLVVDRAAAAGDAEVGQMRGVAAMGRELRGLAGRDAVRVPAVFVPSDRFRSEPGFQPRVPLEMYYWRDGTTWRLVDLTNPLRPFHDSTSERATPRESITALMGELNNKDHFVEGRIYFDLPGVATGQVPVTDDLTWRDFFTWLGIGLAVVGVTLATAGSGTVAVAGMWFLAGSALAGATSATLDLIEGARHGTLTAGQVVLNLAQIVGAIAGVGAMAAGRILSVARASAAASAPLTGARWAQAATLAQRAVIPLAATNIASDAVTLAVLTAQGLEQLAEVDRSGASAEQKQAVRLRILGQLALTGGLTALSLRGNVAEITMGRSIEVVNVGGEPVVVPVGTSFAGRAIERSAADLASSPATGRAAAEARHLEAVRAAVGGTGGEALARVEGLAMARAAGSGAVSIDAAGAIAPGVAGVRTMPELVEQVARANNAARAHGLPTEYVLEMRPGAAAGTTEAVVVTRPRAPAAASATGHLYVGVTARAADEAAQATRLRTLAAATPFRMEVLPDGMIRLNGQVDVHPERLAELSDADARTLMSATRALDDAGGVLATLRQRNAAAAAAIDRFVGSNPKVRPNETPTRGYRLRFEDTRRRAQAFLDDLLSQLGTTRAAYPYLANPSRADLERIWDIANAPVPAAQRTLRTQATRYALDQTPADAPDARAFVEHYEFYVAEFNARVRTEVETRIAAGGLGQPGKPGAIRAVEAAMSDPATLVPRAAVSAEVRRRFDRMTAELNGRVGSARITPGLPDVDAVRAVQALPDVRFGTTPAAVYHAHKHGHEIPQPPAGSPVTGVQWYLDQAQRAIRGTDPAAGAATRSTGQYGGGRSFNLGGAIVLVKNDGEVILLSFQ